MPRRAKYPSLPPEGKVNIEKVCQILGFSRSTLYEYMKRDDFPKPEKHRGCVWFDATEVDTWKEQHQ